MRQQRRNKILSGIFGTSIGLVVFLLLVDMLSKPSNVPLAIKPMDSIQTYFFGFVFSMGSFGWVLGTILLIGFLTFFYYLGTWIYKKITLEK
ncbi:MAG TPA: hypothetical protein VK050_00130 [Flavobacteriaceae bacterium]|nr:hypothetical protein [Flavobacteriaceae bacterium]